jgi:hypothetical protein
MKKYSAPATKRPRYSPSILDDIVYDVMRVEPLDKYASALMAICKAIRNGHDARELFGIKPSRGAPPVTRKYRIWIAQHYARLRNAPDSKELADAKLVADAWGIGIQTVRKCFSEHKDRAYIGTAYEPGTIEAIVKKHAREYARLRRKGS